MDLFAKKKFLLTRNRPDRLASIHSLLSCHFKEAYVAHLTYWAVIAAAIRLVVACSN
jgi:hypothetical protein